ncbi:MAG: bifunctional phosphopantothenoylcysteine decarboxylase/phosphopantothenate--cysteine ligase CoaBC [Nitrospirae bacterium]|nr:bifunctional phosphopantothenoylcysteine decarboxylase/phosphopantothenate--cysteine ligase CoaBC [Nitrospirota bacterium]
MPASVVLGITGSIAAYKSAELARRLSGKGFNLSVVMTESARRFITPLTFETITRRKVHASLWDEPLSHIELAAADLVLVAPATANIIGKAASGIGDDLLSTILVAAGSKAAFAPAMNTRMLNNAVVRSNIERLSATGCLIVPPESGSLACGDEGEGRLASIDEIVLYVEKALRIQDMKGEKVLITSGPTREPMDPVRFISNRSSGKMGAAIAREAFRRGAEVTIVTGPTHAFIPRAVRCVCVETAVQMRDAVMSEIGSASMAVMAAAVADYSPRDVSPEKLPKTADGARIELEPTPDILREAGTLENKPFLVGFSAETGPRTDRATDKMRRKGADMMVFNDVTLQGAGFDTDTNIITIIDRAGGMVECPVMSKDDAASAILDRAASLRS